MHTNVGLNKTELERLLKVRKPYILRDICRQTVQGLTRQLIPPQREKQHKLTNTKDIEANTLLIN